MTTSHLPHPVPLRKRRQVVGLHVLGLALLALAFLFGIRGNRIEAPFWILGVPAFAAVVWSAQQLRSPQWGFFGWTRQPETLDERQKERTLWATAQASRMAFLALYLLCSLLVVFVSSEKFPTLGQSLATLLLLGLATTQSLPLLILAWTEPDLPE
ncbi:MAG: hypothetical protein Q4C89_13985 [Deinococcus sp.]|uniref:hypothetical protein n=1 Tax=Deinococcus sp. TaxID=47478 RepID=UPI0026DD4D7E|nr:hypothetical protein [Deinococcus sp.]MDO4247124.1 hypothetical protein [Deinococcus sp.]